MIERSLIGNSQEFIIQKVSNLSIKLQLNLEFQKQEFVMLLNVTKCKEIYKLKKHQLLVT